jgi:hypothetical protein
MIAEATACDYYTLLQAPALTTDGSIEQNPAAGPPGWSDTVRAVSD